MIVNDFSLNWKGTGRGEYINYLLSNLPKNKKYYYQDINKLELLNIFNIQEFLSYPDDVNLLLDCGMEGYSSMLTFIYNNLIINGAINENRIFLLSGAADITQLVAEKAKQFNRNIFYSKCTDFFELMVSRNIYSMSEEAKSLNTNKSKNGYTKSYLCLNRRWRIHRPTLIGMLAKRKILDYGFVSLTTADDSTTWGASIFDSILSTHRTDKEIYDFFLSEQEYVKNLTPLTLDLKTLEAYSTNQLTDNLNYFYKNSYFSVVTETNFYSEVEKYNSSYVSICQPTRFFSEKTFKPMAYRHPFVMVSVPKMLELLRDMGYKTFHPYINEDYDKEENDGKRLLMIVDEICRLSLLNEKELEEFILNTQDICEHNFKILQQKCY